MRIAAIHVTILCLSLACQISANYIYDNPIKAKTIPLHIPVQSVNSTSTFNVSYWLGAYYADTPVDADWYLPLTIGNGGEIYPGQFLFIRNYGPSDITLHTTYPETIEDGTSYTIKAGSVIEILSGYPNWVVVTPFVGGNVTCGTGLECAGDQINLAQVGTAGTTAYPTSITTNEYGQITAKTPGQAPITSLGAGVGTYVSPSNTVNTYTVTVRDFGAVGDCVTDDTDAFQQAINYVSDLGGGVIFIPSGCYSVTAPVATRVSPNEGAAFLLYAESSNILFQGQSAASTRLVPKSNKVEMFSIAGASNISFDQITFDNSGNGLLQNQAIPPSPATGPNKGVAGLGNAANAAISQWLGSGLTVKGCVFDTFIRAIWYDGNYTDVSIAVGDFVAVRNFFSSCVFCMLVAQPYTVRLEDNEDRYTTYSFNAVGGPDGGHHLYLTNRGGAVPVSVVVNGASSYYSNASVIKINKGLTVAISDMACANSYGCLNLQNVAHATITNIVANAVNRTAVVPNLESQVAFFACGYTSLTNFVIDTRGTDMLGVELGSGTAPQSFSNLDNSISHGTIIYDALSSIDATPVMVVDQVRFKASFVKAVRYGDVALRLSPFQARSCTNCEFLRPSHISINSAAPGTSSLISLDSGTTGTYVTFADNDITGPYSKTVTTVGGSLDRNVLTNPVVRLNHGNYLGVYTAMTIGNTSQPAYTFDTYPTTGLYATGASGGSLCTTANGVATMCHFTNSIRPTVAIWAASYGCVGCTTTPSQTTTGDWTANRLFDSNIRVVRSCTSGAGITCSVTDGVLTVSANANLQDTVSRDDMELMQKRIDFLEARIEKLLQLVAV